jgi:hypothetical protein
MNRKNTLLTLAFVASIACAHQAAASLVCETPEPAENDLLICKNISPKGTTSVLFRNITPWNGHAGITLIDICSGDIPDAFEPKQGCLRRYCTHEGRDLVVQFGPILLPITPVLGAFRFTFVHAEFSVHCKAIDDFRQS